MRSNKKVRMLVFLAIAAVGWQVPGFAQVPSPSAPPPPAPPTSRSGKVSIGPRTGPVIVENRPGAPQVVTILHRLNGLKMFRLLLRSNEELRAIASLDDAFTITDEVHTNVIAGLALDDGETIVAWLPDAEAEMGPPLNPFAPVAPSAPRAAPPRASAQSPRATTLLPGGPLTAGPTNFFERPDLTVIARDGRRLIARYVGLDGVTGLSILKLSQSSLPRAIDAREDRVGMGQRLRLFGPEPVLKPESRTGGKIYARMGETEGTVVGLPRSPSGAIARVKIKSTKFSPANIGGIAVNDAGETVGIVDAVEDGEASVVPSAMVRTAAKRVLDRQASVPRPWLGVRGEPVGALELDQIVLKGWEREGARWLAEARRGIMLTSVAPGSPAAVAALRPGDVILRVNQEDVRSADDFSWLLEEVGPGRSVSFTVARPDTVSLEAVEITLTESPDPVFGLKALDGLDTKTWAPSALTSPLLNSLPRSLIAQGIETIALMPQVAARFGGIGGLLVVFVEPSTAAFKAGLRSGDLIEAIDGKLISFTSQPGSLFAGKGKGHSFSVVRNKEKLVITVAPPK
ncbi:MAG: PDZ domain-containing protein [Pyrinomonadaceae bacterium]|nr:PDZ domain-containing protein [Pyrinomonadaceae bacterium]